MYGTLDAEFEVQRAIKTSELTSFFCLFGRVVGPTTGHVDDTGHHEGTFLEVRHATAHRSRKENQEKSLFERFVAEGNERVDELGKDRSTLDGCEMAQITASTVQQKTGGCVLHT